MAGLSNQQVDFRGRQVRLSGSLVPVRQRVGSEIRKGVNRESPHRAAQRLINREIEYAE
jgi:hypothetical protein